MYIYAYRNNVITFVQITTANLFMQHYVQWPNKKGTVRQSTQIQVFLFKF